MMSCAHHTLLVLHGQCSPSTYSHVTCAPTLTVVCSYTVVAASYLARLKNDTIFACPLGVSLPLLFFLLPLPAGVLLGLSPLALTPQLPP
jgi:hypothetical protein